MEESRILETVTRLFGTDFSTLNAYGLDRTRDDVALLRRYTDSVTIHLTRRAKQLAAEGRTGTPGAMLGPVLGSGEARAAERRDAVAEALPELGDALDQGKVCGEHLDRAGAAMKNLKPKERERLQGRVDEIVAAAESMPPAAFGRRIDEMARETQQNHGADTAEIARRQRHIRTRTDERSNLEVTEIHADPESQAFINTVLQLARERARHAENADKSRTFDQILFDEFLNILRDGAHRDSNGEPVTADVTVIIDEQTLRTGQPHDATVCEYRDGTPLPASTVQRYCCDADLYLAVINEHGVVLDLGRTQRLANRAQRRALRAMYRTCAYEHCETGFDRCRIHHIIPWEHGGPTDLNNLIPVCDEHHHLLHEGRWTIQLIDPNGRREAIWARPDGITHATTFPNVTDFADRGARPATTASTRPASRAQAPGCTPAEPPGRPPGRQPEPPPGGNPNQPDEQPTLFSPAA